MRPSLVRSYLLISVGISLLFILLGVFVVQVLGQIERRKFENNPPIFFAQLVDEAKLPERKNLVEKMKSQNFPFEAWLFSKDGTVLNSSVNKPLPFNFGKVTLPQNDFESTTIDNFWRRPGPPTLVVKLHGKPEQYLVFDPKQFDEFTPGKRRGPPPGPLPEMAFPGMHPPGPPPMDAFLGPPHGPPGTARGHRDGYGFIYPLLIFIVAMLLASGVSVLILFIYIKKTSGLADSVLNELKSGNLKARFPVIKSNEVGNLMVRFNLMADEIEKLFERLKEQEVSRMRLLQDLAHDLRTPVASIQNMLALLMGTQGEIAEGTKLELAAMSHKESLYIGQLINDLLLLSQISSPEPVPKKFVKADLADLIETEIETVQSQNLVNTEKIAVVNNIVDQSKVIWCNPHLLKRLFRNLFDNAFSFAETKLVISAQQIDDKFQVTLEDDGPGFSEEALKNYGERRITRIVEQHTEGRISVGLGSVIIKAIAVIHGVEVSPSNLVAPDGSIQGARVVIKFPSNLF